MNTTLIRKPKKFVTVFPAKKKAEIEWGILAVAQNLRKKNSLKGVFSFVLRTIFVVLICIKKALKIGFFAIK
jgi:hypothetical protein